jgi:hypothetical protein
VSADEKQDWEAWQREIESLRPIDPKALFWSACSRSTSGKRPGTASTIFL